MTGNLLTGAALAAVLAFALHARAAMVTFDYTGSFANYTVPVSGDFRITAYGAQGGGIFTCQPTTSCNFMSADMTATSACRVPAAAAPVTSFC